MSMDENGRWRRSFTVRRFEAAPGGLVHPSRLLDYFQEAAGDHAEALGLGMEGLHSAGVAWVMARVCINIARLPGACETLNLTTWPSAATTYVASRDFKASDAQGRPLFAGTSDWVIFDLEKRAKIELPPGVRERLPDEPTRETNFTARTVKKLPRIEQEHIVAVRRADLDINGHANNVHFLEWCLESVENQEKALASADIIFRSEARAGETLSSRSAPEEQDPTARLHSLVRSEDGRELARARTTWKPVA